MHFVCTRLTPARAENAAQNSSTTPPFSLPPFSPPPSFAGADQDARIYRSSSPVGVIPPGFRSNVLVTTRLHVIRPMAYLLAQSPFQEPTTAQSGRYIWYTGNWFAARYG
jgi:hypothetical protein